MGLELDLLRVIQDQRLDLLLDLIGQLIARGGKQLDAVEFHTVVGGGDHHPGIRRIEPDKGRHSRRGHNAQQLRIGSHRADACRQGSFQNIRGNPGILADIDHRLVIHLPGQHQCRRSADLHRKLTGQLRNRHTSCAVCSE